MVVLNYWVEDIDFYLIVFNYVYFQDPGWAGGIIKISYGFIILILLTLLKSALKSKFFRFFLFSICSSLR